MFLKIPKYIESLVPYVPGKPLDETKRELGLKKVIKLASNENPLGPSPQAVKAVQKALKNLHFYPDSLAYGLRKKLSQHFKLKPENFFIGNGSNEIIEILIRTFLTQKDAMITSKGAFIAYKVCAQAHGVKCLETRLTDQLNFDLEAMWSAIEKNSTIKMVFLPNPNNPTGNYTPHAPLYSFLKKLQSLEKKGRTVLAVLDYAYWEYVGASDLSDPLELFQEFENIIVLRTFSKVYGLAGIRLGYAIARPELLQWAERIREPFNINSLALIAGEAALSDHSFVKKSVQLNEKEKKNYEQFFKKWNIPFCPTQGNFYLIQTKKVFGLSGSAVFNSCLKKGVIFRPVANYGLEDYLRLTIGTASENKWAQKVLSDLFQHTQKELKK